MSSLKLSENTVLNLYADDMLLYKQIKCSEDYQQLQLDIDKISSWVDSNHLSLNPAKCKTAVSNRWTGLWTGSVDWIAGSNQTASKGDDACVAHGTASKAEV